MSDMPLQPSTTTKQPLKAQTVVSWMDAIVAAIEAGGALGAPSGVLYAALSPYMTLDVYQRLMNSMVHMGLLSTKGHLYTLTAKGTEWHRARCL